MLHGCRLLEFEVMTQMQTERGVKRELTKSETIY